MNAAQRDQEAQRKEWTRWAEEEIGGAELGDARRSRRGVAILSSFLGAPEGSIPRSCAKWASAKAAYRFFDNDKVQTEAIYKAHRQSVLARAQDEPVLLAIGDTTQLDYTSHPNTVGIGSLADIHHHGLHLQPTFVVTPQRVALGIIGQHIWVRDPNDSGKSRQKGADDRPIEEKESLKWLVSFETAEDFQRDLGESKTRVISVFDREGDVYELFQRARRPGTRSGLLVRAQYDRRVDHPQKHLFKLMGSQPVAGTVTVRVPRGPGTKEREATLEVRFAQVTLEAPGSRKVEDRTPVSVYCVLAAEVDPPHAPKDSSKISWMLYTTEPVETFEDASTRLEWYSCRWQIEVFFKILKSGCKVEERQLETAERLQRCLPFDCIVAWRILYLTTKGREVPNLPCTAVFEEYEWKGAWAFLHKSLKVPDEPPTLQEVVRIIGRLGGHLGRKQDQEPGPIALWRGLQRLPDLAGMWGLFIEERPSG